MCGLCVGSSSFPEQVAAVPCRPALFLSTSHSPPKQLDFDASQEGVTALNDQPRIACAVHGQPNFGSDVYLHRNIQEADEAGGDQVTHETLSHSYHVSVLHRPVRYLSPQILALILPDVTSQSPKPSAIPLPQGIRTNLPHPQLVRIFKARSRAWYKLWFAR